MLRKNGGQHADHASHRPPPPGLPQSRSLQSESEKGSIAAKAAKAPALNTPLKGVRAAGCSYTIPFGVGD